MKRIIPVLLLAFNVISCTEKEFEIETKQKQNFNTTSAIYKYANAKYPKTKGHNVSIKPICKSSDTLAFILNHGNGWEILSSDERYVPILAKGDGTYNVDSLNPGQNIWLESELETIKAVKDGHQIISDEEISKSREFWNRMYGPALSTKAEGDPIQGWELIEIIEMDDERETSGHILDTQWGQQYPWNQCVPYISGSNNRCVAGCVAVAGAQLLRYLHYNIGKPSLFYTTGSCSGNEYNPTFNFGNQQEYAWDNMALLASEDSDKTFQSSLLIGWVGHMVGMTYSSSGSSASSVDFKELLNDLSIGCSYNDYNAQTVWNQIYNYHPVYIRASTNSGEGHAWIIDGFRRVTIEYRYIYEFKEHDSPYNEYGDIKFETVYEKTNYILMNWGWNNYVDNNSYAIAGAYGWNGGGYIFTNNKKILYNFN